MKNLTPIASAIAILGFFAPWMSCGMITMNGFDLAKGSGAGAMGGGASDSGAPILWIVPIAGVLILALYFLMKNRNTLRSAMIPIILASVAALAVMGMKYVDVKKGMKSGDKTTKTEQPKSKDSLNSSLDSSMNAMATGMETMMGDMIEIKWGFWLTAAAFLACLAGATQLKNGQSSTTPPESGSI